MAFFLETLLGGLMAGMLYSLVALGFVLIFKASGVFNFAQGAMVLFGALSMARFSEWIPQWTGVDSLLMANVLAFIMAAAVMFIVAWAVEYLVLRHLVNQEGATLLMATVTNNSAGPVSSLAVSYNLGRLDLATGAAIMSFLAYVLIGVWQYGQSCSIVASTSCYATANPIDLSIIAAAAAGAPKPRPTGAAPSSASSACATATAADRISSR